MSRFTIIISSISFISLFLFFKNRQDETSWIRINLLGYKPASTKVAVWCSKENKAIKTFQVIDAATKKIAFNGSAGKAFGGYGPFTETYRLNFSSFKKPGSYYLQAGGAKSPVFQIGEDAYKGSADFCLRYMRQQRTGFNPFLKDSCHTYDGYVLYGEKSGIKDSTHIDVVGGWHDASDYLQYSTTSANATYHLLMAYKDFPKIFTDEKLANGLDGKNEIADVLDEAKWGLDWLIKMHPKDGWMFNQIADDRDHQGMRIPKEDSFYGKKYERPVYFINGETQQRGKFLNNTTGTSSTAAKFASAFILASKIYKNEKVYAELLSGKANSAYSFALKKPGVTQTVSVLSPYIYAEDNWVDDMELAAILKNHANDAINYSKQESITPWLGADTAKHYQWYPFINLGHYELAKQLKGEQRDTITGYYQEGIRRVWNKAKQNAFYRGVPFIWCSNNLTTSFAIQCFWYRQLSNDKQFEELEQANFDWLFGCNPWGTSMVYGLPANGDTPIDPHSAFTHLKNYPIDGGLVDGPVYTSIYKNLIGIKLYQPDEYEAFQSNLAVYHDDYGDYSTNEPTMDGTASLIYLLATKENEHQSTMSRNYGGIIRGDSTQKKLAIVFTGHEFAEGGEFINQTLDQEKIKASFFFTGDFYRNSRFKKIIQQLKSSGNYLSVHSNNHLLCCDWGNRDSLLISKETFDKDLIGNTRELLKFGIANKKKIFLPAYEWYNDTIAGWTHQLGYQLMNYTPGTLSHADYTTSSDKNYRSSDDIYRSIGDYEQKYPSGLNGFILLMHIGAGPKRTDKFYHRLPQLVQWLKNKGYQFVRVDEL
jgi:peptidoglycan/xylan/chitin deacetylase (PgdA/CDA1 family)